MDNEAVTAPLGVILLMPSLLLAAMAGVVMFNNMAEWSQAEGDRAQFYAECAHAQITEGVEPHPKCPSNETKNDDSQEDEECELLECENVE